jgi:hypothetical protein
LKSRDDARRVTEVAIAVKSLNRMRDLGQARSSSMGYVSALRAIDLWLLALERRMLT